MSCFSDIIIYIFTYFLLQADMIASLHMMFFMPSPSFQELPRLPRRRPLTRHYADASLRHAAMLRY